MQWLDWSIVIGLTAFILGIALYARRYNKSVADFLVANRCAGRYLIAIAQGEAGFAAVTTVAAFEMFYRAGFTGSWWNLLLGPVGMMLAVSGYVMYRFRETRAMTLAQFFEMRYSKRFRIFAGILAWLSGLINFGIFPGVGARFFIYFCGMPDTVPGLGIPTYPTVMAFLLLIAVGLVFLGGQITVMITDFWEGVFSNVALIVVLGFFFMKFGWSDIIATVSQAPENASLLNPFKTTEIDSFNMFFFLIGIFMALYCHGAWQGGQGYFGAARTPHEAKMANILGEWRVLMKSVLILMLPLGAYVVMHSPAYSGVVDATHAVINTIDNEQIQKQMLVPIVLSKVLPTGIMGALCAVMLAAFVSTNDTYLHSWGSIFIQDVILPFRKKPFSTRQHLWLLRFSVLFVATFAFLFSLLFRQNEYIHMFFSITGAIYLGGAGACILGGLYWKRGSTSGAWVALSLGASLAIATMALRQTWASHVYPWMETSAPWLLNGLRTVMEGVANRVPGIHWQVGPEKFPMNSRWVLLFMMFTCAGSYILCSLFEHVVLRRPAFNIDRMLHRGKYAIGGEHLKGTVKPPTGWRTLLPTKEFSRGDKVIYGLRTGWMGVWFMVFLTMTLLTVFRGQLSNAVWIRFWGIKICVFVVVGVITTIWFLIGGIVDMKDLFRRLREEQLDARDDGMVVGHHNLADDTPDDSADVLDERGKG